jgi:hypothetical protein
MALPPQPMGSIVDSGLMQGGAAAPDRDWETIFF